MTQVARAREVLKRLAALGVAEAVVCAGARNAPFVKLLSAVRGWKVHGFFEERSAGFFALGRARASGRPVVVCTTSGTAVAELLPAVIEADYQGVPLIVLSADRPRSYRGTGAPQTIVQPGIFGGHVERGIDLENEIPLFPFSGRRPLHVNVCLSEPLLDEEIGEWSLEPAACASSDMVARPVAIGARRPLILVSGLAPAEAERIRPILQSWRRPVYVEATSQLRGRLGEWEVAGSEPSQLQLDGVIRIGGVPTLRYWRDLETLALPVWHFSNQPYCGLPRERQVHSLASLGAVNSDFESWSPAERDQDRARAARRDGLLAEFPLSEPAWVRRLSEGIPAGSFVFVGNSLPIREWDFCARGGHRVEGNRGVNGIDGLVSTFLGMVDERLSNWAVIGDLSALYDLAGLWAAQMIGAADLNLVVINNGGGKIFSRMFNTPLFENRHRLEFSGWAKLWGWDYVRLSETGGDWPSGPGRRIIEVVPDDEQTRAFFTEWEKS